MMPDESTPEALQRYVFVYGTLRQGGSNDITRLQPAARFVGRAAVPGLLYHLGAYPGLVLACTEGSGAAYGAVCSERQGQDEMPREVQSEIKREIETEVREEVSTTQVHGTVQGEVYAISPILESILDEIEGLGPNPTDEYFRREIEVMVQGHVLSCLVYEINPGYVSAARAIAHGDWIQVVHDS